MSVLFSSHRGKISISLIGLSSLIVSCTTSNPAYLFDPNDGQRGGALGQMTGDQFMSGDASESEPMDMASETPDLEIESMAGDGEGGMSVTGGAQAGVEIPAGAGAPSGGVEMTAGVTAGVMGGSQMNGGTAPCENDDCDRDGVSVADGDCDDSDMTTYPGAPEICDLLDNDCDERFDEIVILCYDGAEETLGFGQCSSGIKTCEQGQFGSCEDQTLPREETCDTSTSITQIDEDCDGVIDEGCDEDRDGSTVDQGDCDDGNPDIFPGAVEVCNGLDDNCNQRVDEVVTDCYMGPASTRDVGVCQSGTKACFEGMVGRCENQVLPSDELCGFPQDEDCDGAVDEGCDTAACIQIDRSTPIQVSASCLTAGTGATTLIRVRPLLTNGAPVPSNVRLTLQAQVASNISDPQQLGDEWYWTLRAPTVPTTLSLNVNVDCGDGQEVTLTDRPQIEIAPLMRGSGEFDIGGCPSLEGSLFVEVHDDVESVAIPSAWVMVGDTPEVRLQNIAEDAVSGLPGQRSNVFRTNVRGRISILDYGEVLRAPQTLTVGAEGYENVTIHGVDAGQVFIRLRPIELPEPPPYSTQGQVNNFENLSRDEALDLAFVLPSLTVKQLSTLSPLQLLSRSQCWRPINGGIFPVSEVAIPGNLYIPNQPEQINFFIRFNILEHQFQIMDIDRPTDHLVALSGKMQVATATEALQGNGTSLANLLNDVEFTRMGVRLNQTLSTNADTDEVVNIPLSIDLSSQATCTLGQVPDGAYGTCITAGQWAGGDRDRVFPMGISNFEEEALATGDLTRPISMASRTGELSNIEYLSAGIALFSSTQPQLKNATSAILDRSQLTDNTTNLRFTSFLNTTPLTRSARSFIWNAVSTTTTADLCEIEVLTTRQETYDPGGCSEPLTRDISAPLWLNYVLGDPGRLTLPTLPPQWPRGAAAGLRAPEDLSPQDKLEMRVRCQRFEGDAPLDFHQLRWRELQLTHVSFNQVDY
jgi:hypothetical protein